MSFDSVVTNPGRLSILTALAVEERQEFVQLRHSTQLTDGNLSAHARRLKSAGLVDIDKQFRDGKPVTSFVLTSAGRSALESHARRLLAAISHRRVGGSNTVDAAPHRPAPRPAPRSARSTPSLAAETVVSEPTDAIIDEWID